ncbi:hypothetical protein [Nonomuraea jiangxiensis]|uniref:Intracellular septation protein A n=1 Tax=Nonomuraea jiangxiensis TaxID=633440 RepID=A0A1G7YG79_9ACTN|nr:hypothetical protein [Nonomuraea jiangxiensis]SDG95538.1 hypothetical protein SAMN05421869_101109 [Nonomuraea jiangxiensis]
MEQLQISLLVLLAIAFVIYRQLQARPTGRPVILITSGVMIVAGLVLGGLFDSRHVAVSVALLLVEAAASVALGMWRASTVRVWLDGSGVAWSKATGWTLVGWLASIATRLVLLYAGNLLGLSPSTGGILLFVGITIGVQSYLVARRGRALASTGRQADTVVA